MKNCGFILMLGALKRSDFGMKWGIPATSDDVKIMITFEAFKD